MLNNEVHMQKVPGIVDLLVILLMTFGMLAVSETFASSWTYAYKYLLYELMVLAVLFLYTKTRGLNVRFVLRLRLPPGKMILPIIGLSVSSIFLLEELDRLVQMLIKMPPERIEELSRMMEFTSLLQAVVLILSVSVLAAFTEECTFRGIFQTSLERRMNPTTAVLAISLLFSVMHFQFYWMIQLLVLSVFLGYLSWLTGSIAAGFLIHMFNNAWTVVQLNNLQVYSATGHLWKGHVNPLLLIASLLIFIITLKIIRTTYVPEKE